ncbi:MAG TPA: UDP-glucose 4-epimerase GalE [Nitrospiraceae bacterium]|nr:UDP-glucose 4-epimerase GalE [Nitrospiraceae bacterium]
MKIVVTGGAGYIGSHVVRALGEQGHEVLIYDNLSKGHRDAVLHGELVVGDLADTSKLEKVFGRFQPVAVMHFAALIEVGESVREPATYYRNNVANTLNLLSVMLSYGVRSFIFSSSAAVYGNPQNVPISEQEPLSPINPYGRSKVFVEKVLEDMSASQGMRYVSLRYFNAAGAEEEGRIGEHHDPESHLIPLTLKAAKGERSSIKIFGVDYPTPDGTCIRDYVHVSDLAEAHILSLEHLADGSESRIFNCGYGHGFSVRQVVETAIKVTGIEIRVEEVGRRPGDPPVLVAESTRLRQDLGWNPRHDDLEDIIRTAWAWERKQRA